MSGAATPVPASQTVEAAPLASAQTVQGRWYALILLMVMYSCNALDRGVINVVLEPIKHEFRVSDAKLGFAAGLAFSISFGIAAIPVSLLIDRVNRVKLLGAIMVIWSGMTALCGLAQSYLALVFARMGVGAAESGGQPTAVSLISDLFPPNRRASAIGVFYMGSAVGTFASYLIGGLVSSAYGWRSAFLVAGVPGVIVALVVLGTLKHPARGGSEELATAERPSSAGFFRYVLGDAATVHLVLGAMVTGAVLGSFWAWLASTLIRVHGLHMAQVGVAAALVGGVCQGLSSFTGGWWADRLAKTRPARLAVAPAVAMALAAPFGVSFCLAPNLPLALASALAFGLVSSVWAGPTYALALNLAPPAARGRIAATIQVASGVIGAGLGPVMVGALSDHFGGGRALGKGLALILALALWAALHFALAFRRAQRRLEPALA